MPSINDALSPIRSIVTTRMEELQRENQRLRALLAAAGVAADQQEPAAPSQGQTDLDFVNRHAPVAAGTPGQGHPHGHTPACLASPPYLAQPHSLSRAHVERYSRHLLLPSFGLAAQERLVHGSVLIVGCGGLGSPAALYLAAAGVGRIGLVDHDAVDVSNLHRQVIHTEDRVGQHKAESAAHACRQLNSLVRVETHTDGFHSHNALGLVQQYDVVLDASDNPPTRYLISDACVVVGRPLVSAAALGTDGQLTVYNHGADGPCYRCLFPSCPAPENCARCADAGVLGPVPGVMGVLQALEVIKVLSGVGDVLARRLMVFDAMQGRFTVVKLRTRRPDCAACGEQPSITSDTLASYDYRAFTGQPASDGPPPSLNLIPDAQRLTVQELRAVLASAREQQAPPPQLLDVRPGAQVALLSFPGAVHVPFEQLDSRIAMVTQLAERAAASGGPAGPAHGQLIVLCRRGNNSQRVVERLRQLGVGNVVDVVGGVDAWVRTVEPHLPHL